MGCVNCAVLDGRNRLPSHGALIQAKALSNCRINPQWRKVAPRLAQDFTVVIPDLRGGPGDRHRAVRRVVFGSYAYQLRHFGASLLIKINDLGQTEASALALAGMLPQTRRRSQLLIWIINLRERHRPAQVSSWASDAGQ